MERVALFVVAAVGLSVAALSLRADADGSRPDAVRGYADGVEARAAAFTGEAVARRAVLDALAGGGFTGPLAVEGAPAGPGAFRAVARRTGTTVDIDSEGRAGRARHARRHRYRLAGASPVHRPALLVNRNLEVANPVTIRSGVPGLNADLHTNETLTTRKGPIRVDGHGYYGDKFSNNSGVPTSEMFRPPSPEGPLVAKVAPIKVPVFDVAAARARADRVVTGAYTLPSTLTLGTRERPVILFVDGAVSTSGPVTVQGYGAIVSTYSVFIGHDVTTAREPGSPVESSLAFYSAKNIGTTRRDLTVHAQMFTNGNINMATNTTVVGSVAARGNVSLDGPLDLTYLPRNAAIDQIAWGPSSGAPGSGGPRLVPVAELEGVADV